MLYPPTLKADLRINAFTDVEVNLVGEAAQALGMAPATPEPAPDAGASATPSAATDKAAEAKKPAAAAGVGSAESGEWNEEQEAALVKAMKEFGKELPAR